MSRQPRINLKLIVAGICILAGLVILWRTFGGAPAQVAEAPTAEPILAPTRRANAELSTPMPSLTATLAAATVLIESTAVPATNSPVPTALLEPPTPIVPTAAPALPTPIVPNPLPTLANQIPVPTAVPATLSPVIATNAPSLLPSTTAQIAPTAALPTNTAVVASLTATLVPTIAGTTPTATRTASPTLSPTTVLSPSPSPTPAAITVTYRVEGVAQRVYVNYIDAQGKPVDVEVSTPWTLTITTAWDADLAVDASTDNDINVQLSCSILINGTSAVYDSQNSITGVSCERYLN